MPTETVDSALDAATLLTTGYGQAEDREKTRALGFVAHLVKPVTPERLEEEFALARSAATRERLAAAP